MTLAALSRASVPGVGELQFRPARPRAIFIGVIAAAAAASVAVAVLGANSPAALEAGADLTRLLRFMALLKGAMAVGGVAAVAWRLGAPVSWLRLGAYTAVCTAMVAGPGLIWAMTHVGVGALLLHGGLAAAAVMLWRDPAVPARLEAVLARRRSRAGRISRSPNGSA